MTAQSLQLYGHVSTVLKDLGDLYAEQGLTNEALTMYTQLVRAEQQAYNQHGILVAYDRVGQLYLESGDPGIALVAFRAGLAFAESLSYRQPYFTEQVARLSSDTPVENPAPPDTPSFGEALRDSLRDNPPFDLDPADLDPNVEPAEATETDLPASPPEVEVISDDTIDIPAEEAPEDTAPESVESPEP